MDAPRTDRAVHLLEACIFDHCRNGASQRDALICNKLNLTYEELGRRVSQATSHLRAAGLRPGGLLFLAVSESINFVVSFFAGIGAGYCVVPVSPRLSSRDFALLIAAFKPRAVLAEPERISELSEGKRVHPELAIIDNDIFSHSNSSPAPTPKRSSYLREEFCYGVLTSGTTGIPKLVLRRHEDIIMGWKSYACGALGMTNSDVIFSTAPFCFGYGLGSGLIFPLLSGGAAILGCSKATERIEETKPSILFSQPATLRDLLLSLDAASLGNTRVTVSAGERMPRSLPQEWASQFGHPLLDGYGTTEVGHVFVSQTFEHALIGSVGRAVQGFSLELIDADGRVHDFGGPGILRVRGPARLSSYYLDETSTNQTFGDGAILTPDLATISPEGDVFILGRTNDVIQFGAEAVSLGVIEQCVLDLSFVKECHISKRKRSDPSLADYLVLEVVLAEVSSEPAALRRDIARAIQAETARTLVDEESICFVEAIPRNANGKVVRSRGRLPLSAQFKC